MLTQQKSWGAERPVRWLKLEADILEKANEERTKVLRLSDVKVLAEAYAMSEDEIKSFLRFHHTMGDFLYYPDTSLKNLVITDPQWLIDSFKDIITTREFIDKRPLSVELRKQLKQGIVSKKILKLLWKSRNVDFLAALLMKFHLMLRLATPTSSEKSFLIPAMLPKSKQDMYTKEPFNNMIMVYNSFHEVPNSESIPIGTFHRFVARCANRNQWRLCREDHLSYTDVSFELRKGVRLALTQLKNQIRISIWFNRDVFPSLLRSVLPKIRDNCSASLTKLGVTKNKHFLVICPHCAPGDECLVRIKNPEEDEVILVPEMNKCPIHQDDVSEGDFTWLKKSFVEPSLMMLCQGKIKMHWKWVFVKIRRDTTLNYKLYNFTGPRTVKNS